MAGFKRWISSIKNTVRSVIVERMPAKSFGLSSAGAEVTLKSTPSSWAVIWASVVFPRPGGPINKR